MVFSSVDPVKRHTLKPNLVFKRSLIAVCVMTSLQAQYSSAQTESDDTVAEEVIVTGVRKNIENANDIKRNAQTFVDAISAEDIGDLPDVSVLESLQRLPGIVIERFASSNDSDHFSTEGSQATLRGLPQTRSAFNGRSTFSANSNRGLGYEDIAPELLGSVQVFKNQTADMIEGGISGTISLNTRKPFDSTGRQSSISVGASYGELVDSWSPTVSGLYSDRFALDIGEIGVLASFSSSDREFRSDGSELGKHVLVADAAGAGQDRFAPINAGVRSTTTDRDRTGLALAVQFANTSGTFEALTEYFRSDSSTVWDEHAFFSDDQDGTVGAGAEYDGNTFKSGVIKIGSGKGFGPQSRRQDSEELVEDFSLNLKFQVTDRLRLEGDLQYVDATTDVVDLSMFGGLINGTNIVVDGHGDTPKVQFKAPDGSNESDAEYFANKENYFWRAAMDHIEESEGDMLAMQLDADLELDSSFFTSLETGVRFAERDQTTRWSTYNWGNLSEAWSEGYKTFGGTQIPSKGVTPNFVESPPVESFNYAGFHNGDAGPGVNGLFPGFETVRSYDAFDEASDKVSQSSSDPNKRRESVADRAGVVDTYYLPAEINKTIEENTAIYIKANFEQGIASGNFGLRYVNVDTSVGGGITIQPLTNTDELELTDDEIAFFGSGLSDQRDAKSSFSKVLPSANLKLDVADDVLLRFAYSSAIAFPDLGNLRYNYNISARISEKKVSRIVQISGNPFLEPMESDNFDASVEWYFQGSNSITAGIFYKDVKGFFVTTSVDTPVTAGGVTQTVEVNQPINIDDASIQGFEFAYNQFFDNLPGLLANTGIQFNYTHLSDSGVPNQNNRPNEFGESGGNDPDANVARITAPFDGLPLEGLSENAFNLAAIYEDDRFTARLAYNWRDDYLLTTANVNLKQPVYSEARGQLDGSFSYRLNDIVEFKIQGTNLLEETQNTDMQVNQEGLRVRRNSFVVDRRFDLSVKATF